jgi:hypothetical protein
VAKLNAAQSEAEMSSVTPDLPPIICHQCGSSGPLRSRDFVNFLLRNAWISVEHELPSGSQEVLILTSHGVELGKFLRSIQRWVVISTRNHVKIAPPTHWMPKPEPPL